MRCPYCSHEETRVTNKRESPNGEIRRRRECLKCKKRFTTHEKIEPLAIYVIKKDGRREPFMREKIERALEKAFEKRPVSKDKIEKMINNIEDLLRKKGKKEIKSSLIGEIVIKRIKQVDNIAYVRFASVYKDFKDISDFKNELNELGTGDSK